MTDEESARITEAMGRLIAERDSQVIALLSATWAALGTRGLLDRNAVFQILDDAEKSLQPGERTEMIQSLRRRLVPPH